MKTRRKVWCQNLLARLVSLFHVGGTGAGFRGGHRAGPDSPPEIAQGVRVGDGAEEGGP